MYTLNTLMYTLNTLKLCEHVDAPGYQLSYNFAQNSHDLFHDVQFL